MGMSFWCLFGFRSGDDQSLVGPQPIETNVAFIKQSYHKAVP